MTASPRHDFAALAAYLHSNREFVAPAVEAAVRSLRVPDGARVLDTGTGAGGGLVALAGAAEDVRVVGVDLNPAVLDLAACGGVCRRTDRGTTNDM
jgi:methylase of polypeptide subunit release factors